MRANSKLCWRAFSQLEIGDTWLQITRGPTNFFRSYGHKLHWSKNVSEVTILITPNFLGSQSSQQAEENILFFVSIRSCSRLCLLRSKMPYLHYENHAMYKDMAKVVSDLPEQSSHITDRVVCSYLQAEYPLHPRRTLDQFYYNPLDTQQRDDDQVVYRYTRSISEPKMMMVDQLWLWLLNDGSEY